MTESASMDPPLRTMCAAHVSFRFLYSGVFFGVKISELKVPLKSGASQSVLPHSWLFFSSEQLPSVSTVGSELACVLSLRLSRM